MKGIIKFMVKEELDFINTIKSFNLPYYTTDENDWFEDILTDNNHKQIREGLIKTYPFDFTIKRLNQYGGTANSNQDKTQIYYRLDDKNDINRIKENLVYINSLGYFVSQFKVKYNENFLTYLKLDEISNFNNIIELWLIIEPKFDSIKETEVEFLYHLTKKKYVDKIKINGLIPKSKSKKSYHPDRIYVTIEINDLNNILHHFLSYGKKIEDFVILKIDYDKAGNPKIYNDPNYLKLGYYIIDNISPISIIEEINPTTIL